jgi:hypothetical protein
MQILNCPIRGAAVLGLICGLVMAGTAGAQTRGKPPQPPTPPPFSAPAYPVPTSAVSSSPIPTNGPWALLDSKAAGGLDRAVSKQYLYVYQDRWYLSPATKLSWDWNLGQQVAGTYMYFNGTTTGSVDCSGSTEQPTFGVGCSEGAGDTRKVIPWNAAITATTRGTKSPSTGQGTVCQGSVSAAFGPDPCYQATIYIREVYALLTDTVAATLQPSTTKRYLYVYQDRWYRSPATTLSWNWQSGQQLIGTYDFFDGSTSGTVQCVGSPELPTFGIGCSEGAGATRKVLPWEGSKAPSTAQGTVCQDIPAAFGPEPCYIASIFVLER